MGIAFHTELPTVSEYSALRCLAGWGDISEDVASKALSSTAISICTRYDGALVGLGRVVGDNALYYYVSDIFVHPDRRGLGLGEMIISRLVNELKKVSEPGATIAVLSAPGRCPNDFFGEGMVFLEPIERMLPGSTDR